MVKLVVESAGSWPPGEEPIWVVTVHLNHYFLQFQDKIDPVIPGQVMALPQYCP